MKLLRIKTISHLTKENDGVAFVNPETIVAVQTAGEQERRTRKEVATLVILQNGSAYATDESAADLAARVDESVI